SRCSGLGWVERIRVPSPAASTSAARGRTHFDDLIGSPPSPTPETVTGTCASSCRLRPPSPKEGDVRSRGLSALLRSLGQLTVGGDKWAQLIDPVWYGGSELARDEALRRIRRIVVAPRASHQASGCETLELGDMHPDVSATEARSGRTDWMAPEAAEFDARTGAWTDSERYH